MKEYVGYKEPIGDGLFNMGVTDEEIIRCRDCKQFHVDQSDHDYREPWYCDLWCTDIVKPDGFCSWAERDDQ